MSPSSVIFTVYYPIGNLYKTGHLIPSLFSASSSLILAFFANYGSSKSISMHYTSHTSHTHAHTIVYTYNLQQQCQHLSVNAVVVIVYAMHCYSIAPKLPYAEYNLQAQLDTFEHPLFELLS